MKRIKKNFVKLIEINKSKFYGILFPVDNVEEVKEYLNQVRKDYPKATHYCYAYRVNGLEKSNDDGEPSGTAGRPMLEYLRNNDLENILCVSVRYFGGIKLGASGLLRAYVDSLREVYAISEVYEVREQNIYSIKMNYSLYDIVRNYISKLDGFTIETKFEEEVEIIYSALTLDEFKLVNLTNNQIKIVLIGNQLVYSKIEK
ncbi:MAG: YigZ family protein [Erysipelotrichaceae bacterium]|nr:YigZ family protein [Erysipelotrichaceae bacterium]